MGHQPNKYHISDDGTVYRINEDGSFTSVGNIEDIEKESSSTAIHSVQPVQSATRKISGKSEAGFWNRNYNRLWATTIVLFVGWFISCLSCSEFQEEYWSVDHYEYGEYIS
ncbi:MAG: hypothetical protein K2M06_09290, partial [Muribaculaceae bacterium]|nr:hypothetical protein [Muribaculaceae bacterium]